MTDIEKKALALVNEVLAEWGVVKNAVEVPKNSDAFARALLRAIERHEAFRQEVSDAVVEYFGEHLVAEDGGEPLARFIIAKPDPLVEVLNTLMMPDYQQHEFREAIAKRGGKIVWENSDA